MEWKYTDLFDGKSVHAFGKWCANKVDFAAAQSKRKRSSSETISVRPLFVLKEQYIDDIAQKVQDYLPQYQLFIETLKKERYQIVGYARKSKTKGNDESRIHLLQQMGRRLKERSLVDKIFVSPLSNANDEIIERDLKKSYLLKQLDVDGDTQGTKTKISRPMHFIFGLTSRLSRFAAF
ncbi:hypothetical protein BDF20DRAFT_873977 [Mycotypha africana]|uniref:uncharacterized protein n=1 Tax=Mycotypha africana TaxID=64632 RepID=UPI00230164E8|nr:uncharacterized protein BDF20DRAFT_873977 [Mycotypha africana]KAI8977281.1 hypothetical protein BDF20DRAFT_873977 [Mycotypha africana]